MKLVYRELDDYKYQLKKDVHIQTKIKGVSCKTEFIRLYENGQLHIKAGYAWNGSNWSSDKHAMLASLVHDVLYQLMRLDLLSRAVFRKPADVLYRDICILEGMSKFEAGLRYQGLRWFGKSSTYPEKNPRGETKTIRVSCFQSSAYNI